MTDKEVTEEMFEVLQEIQDIRLRYLAVKRKYAKIIEGCEHIEVNRDDICKLCGGISTRLYGWKAPYVYVEVND